MHVPADVWQMLLTQVSEPAPQSWVVVHEMFAQPFVCDHTGPDMLGEPQCWNAGHAAPGPHAVGSHAPEALHEKPEPQLFGVHAGPHIKPTPVSLQLSGIALHTSPPVQVVMSSQPCIGAIPHRGPSSGPAQPSPEAQSLCFWQRSPTPPLVPQPSTTQQTNDRRRICGDRASTTPGRRLAISAGWPT
jgi:hypothetical protein